MFDHGLGFTELGLNMFLHDSSFARSNTFGLSTVMLDIILEHNCLIIDD